MKRNIFLYLITLFLLVACAEQEDAFVIKGKINNMGGRPLFAVYNTDMGVEIDTLIPIDGKIEMVGRSTEIVPIQLYELGWHPFMRLYLCNGQRVELNGDANAPYEIEMKGNKLNRNLWKFICKHKEIFTDSYSAGVQSEFRARLDEVYEQKIARLDSLLIDYIENHPSDVMSSILIGDYLLRYDNYALCNTLWQGLSVKAQLPYIAQTMEHLSRDLAITNENGKLPYMRMLSNNDSICYISTRKSKATLVCIWNTIDEQSEVMHKVLQHYARRYTDRQLQIATISFDGDTARWHSVVDSDTSRVVDMWSDGLYTSDVFAKYNITRLPVYMLGDSLGNVLVRTSQLPDQDIDAQLDSLVSIDKYKIETPILKP